MRHSLPIVNSNVSSSKMETFHPRICKFYKENPTIDFETVNLQCIELFEKSVLQRTKNTTNEIVANIQKPTELTTIKRNYIQEIETLISAKQLNAISFESQNEMLMEKLYYLKNELFGENETCSFHEILGKLHSYLQTDGQRILKNNADWTSFLPKIEYFFFALSSGINASTSIPYDSRKSIPQLLMQTYDTAETISVEDCILMRREAKPSILFKDNDGSINVNTEEISKFLITSEEHHCHGVFMSQYSGIVGKPNYHIEIYNQQNIIVYIHNVQYASEKMKMAVDIIDNLESQFKKWNILRSRGMGAEETHTMISKEILDEINKEYQSFIVQKLTIIQSLKESQRKVEDMKLAALDTYLSTKYASNRSPKLICDLCNIFNACNLKALAAHKRGCKRKTIANSSVETVTS